VSIALALLQDVVVNQLLDAQGVDASVLAAGQDSASQA